jgi:hypothetical protein
VAANGRSAADLARSAAVRRGLIYGVGVLDLRTAGLVGSALLLVAMTWMTLSIMRQADSSVTTRIRAALRERLGALRLARMLKRRGIGGETFIASAEPDTVKAQLSACESCVAVVQCDNALASELPLKDISFCANAAALEALTHHGDTAAANDEDTPSPCARMGCGRAG